MIDPLAAALAALTTHSPAAFCLLFLAGVLTSIGPCVAPRYVAITALASGQRRPIVPTLAFVLGLITAFATLGFAAGLLGSLWAWSSAMYLLLAGGLIGGGAIALMNAEPAHAAGDHCSAPATTRPAGRSLGAIFLLGAASALIISPCCTPVVAVIVATSTSIGQPVIGGLLLLSYALGHALPLLLAGQLGGIARRLLPQHFGGQAPAIVGAVLMLVLGCYYGALA